MREYRLSDLLDLAIFQKMADAHYQAAGMPIGIIDAIDGSILVGSGWQDVCVNFHRANPVSLQRCRESDDYIKGRLVQGEACQYKCKNGLWDIGMPIVVAGRHLATMFLGQFFYEREATDREFFIQQARELGFDVDGYLAALDRVPVFSREKVDYILEYDRALVSLIADLAEHSLMRSKADEIIRENERKFHAVFDQAYQFLGLLSTDGRMLEVNRTTLRFTGSEEADFLARPYWETPLWTHSPQLQERVRLAAQSASKGKFVRFEATHRAADGNLHCVDFSLKPATDKAGKVVLLISEGRDITERKQAEEALSRTEEKYRSMFENALEGIYQATVEGSILSCNPALARILGYDSPEELMKSITDIAGQVYVNPERRSELLRLVEKQGEAKGFETQFFKKDKSIAWVAINVRGVRDEKGKLAYLEGILQDVTERKALESRLFQSQKMEAVGGLAGGIAHDFNNMLAAIIGYAEITEAKLRQKELRPYLDQILRAADRAKNLVTQILTFSRKADKEMKPVEISSLVIEVLRLLRATIPSTIEIRREIPPSVGEVLADPVQLHQVLMNLCTNAAHAMREKGGTLTIDLSNADITAETSQHCPDLKPGRYVKLRVGDTGTGIPQDILGRIFDPFFTTKKPGEGTGLGLSVVYGIVKECGGTITVWSEPGKGSTFSIYLPVIEHGVGLATEPSGSIPAGSERILFVDDEEALTEMGRELLERLGYEVTAITGSESALEIFRANPDGFDLVITDMTMPGMTGKRLASEILAIRPDIPIILCTGFSEIITEEEARFMGIREFAMKPLNLRSIAELVRKALESR